MNIPSPLITAAIATLPRTEVFATLHTLGIPCNEKKSPNKVLAEAITQGHARLSIAITIKMPYIDTANPDPNMPPIHHSRIYTYKDRKSITLPHS